MENTKDSKKCLSRTKINTVLQRLEAMFPDAKPELSFDSVFELLVAVILSAQCTDVRVNKVTSELFKTYNTPEAMLTLSPEALEVKIKSCGLAKSKANNILKTCRILMDTFHGEIPKDIETLQTLPGVGRKTANVVASVAFGVPAIAVDTHVFRVSNRIGLANAKDVLQTERQLQKAIPMEKWAKAHHWLIFLGRRVCSARAPQCDTCALRDICLNANEKMPQQSAKDKGN